MHHGSVGEALHHPAALRMPPWCTMSGSPWHLALSISALRDSRLLSASMGWDDWRNGPPVFVNTAVPPFGTWVQRALPVEANLLDVADGVEDAATPH